MGLVVTDVSKSFPSGHGIKPVLQNVTFESKDNEFVCVLGHSGCGKSTLLNMIAGFASPDDGFMTVNGEQINGPDQERGVVFQEHALFPWYTVLENIALGPTFQGKSKEESQQIAKKYLALVNLEDAANQYPSQLSGGMKQRVGIARALANEPKILLMDEPFGALDILTRETMRKELLNIWMHLRTMVVFVTHSIAEAVHLADRILVMKQGEIASNIEVHLDRPRDAKHPQFLSLVDELSSILIEEKART
ncbi:ABC transporter [Bacillaceae bacterium JMAK1]|nr:ABC transporter [Bacillaceae bacterium JMAK1]